MGGGSITAGATIARRALVGRHTPMASTTKRATLSSSGRGIIRVSQSPHVGGVCRSFSSVDGCGAEEGPEEQKVSSKGKRLVVSCARVFSSMANNAVANGAGTNFETDDAFRAQRPSKTATQRFHRSVSETSAASATFPADIIFTSSTGSEAQNGNISPSVGGTKDKDTDSSTASFRSWVDEDGHSDQERWFETASPSDMINVSMKDLFILANQKTTALSLSDMYRYAKTAANAAENNGGANCTEYRDQRLFTAQFLHRELPIRIAQRAVDLLNLPTGLSTTTHVRAITNRYLHYLQKFLDFSYPTTYDQERDFTDMLHSLVLYRKTVPNAIARGLLAQVSKEDQDEDKTTGSDSDPEAVQQMEDALYRFFTARVGLRFLTEHYVLSSVDRAEQNAELRKMQSCLEDVHLPCEETEEQEVLPDGARLLGCIQRDCDPALEIRRVAAQVKRHCFSKYGMAPEIEVVDYSTPHMDGGKKGAGKKRRRRDFTYVPHHLQYMVAEILKNSSRATVRRYMQGQQAPEQQVRRNAYGEVEEDGIITAKPNDNDSTALAELPPIRVVVVKGEEDVTIKVSDKGGGVPRSAIGKLWTFAHSTRAKAEDSDEDSDSESESGSDDEVAEEMFETDEITGGKMRGFGLPLARIYARYFGGELTLKSMEGYGVDAYLYLPVLGTACENLPDVVTRSPGNLDSRVIERET